MNRKTVALSVAAACGVLGCATIDPYVLPYSGKGADAFARENGQACQFEKKPVCVLRSMQAGLAEKLREHTVAGAVSGSLLFPLASLVAYKGATGGSEHHIAALSSGGFAANGTLQYLYKRPRELIYVSGIGALDCVIRLGQPHLRNPPRDRLEAAERVHDDLNRLRAGLTPPLDAALQADLADVRARLAIVRAETARREAISDQYAAEMYAAGFRVMTEVNRQLAFLAPDPEAIQGSLGSLALPRAPEPAPAKPEASGPRANYAVGQELDRLRADRVRRESFKRSLEETRTRYEMLEAQWLDLSVPGIVPADTRSAEERRARLATVEGQLPPELRSATALREKISFLDGQIASLDAGLAKTARQAVDLESVLSRLDQMAAAVSNAEADVHQQQAAEPSAIDFAACGVDQSNGLITGPLVTDPGQLELSKGGAASVYVSGGVGLVVASVVARPATEPAGALTVEVVDVATGIHELKVTAAGTVVAGSHAILARDASGRARLIPVTIR